jgi:hypothetical protein
VNARRHVRALLVGVVSLLGGLAGACGGPPAAGFGNNPVAPAPQVAEPFRLSFSPPAVMTGGTSVATAMLTLPAPAGGLVVAISGSGPAVSVPASVSVPAGMQAVDFPVSSAAVTADTDVAITMSTTSRSVSGTFSVWAVLPNFFSFVSESGDPVGHGLHPRATMPAWRFISQCSDSRLEIQALTSGMDWFAAFSAPTGQPLRVGTYENTIQYPAIGTGSPGLSIFGNGVGCSGTGRFVVREVDLAQGGIVRAFWATFEQRCNGFTGWLRGDVRVTNPPDTVTSTPAVTCLR